MKKLITILLTSLVFLAQADETTIWQDSTLADTVRLKAIDNAAWGAVFTEPQKAIKLAEIQKELAERFNSPHYIAQAYNTLGVAHYARSDYIKAIRSFEKSLELKKAVKDSLSVAKTLNNLVGIYASQGKYKKALEYLTQSQVIYENLGDSSGLAGTYNNLGNIYKEQGDYANAQKEHAKALSYYKALQQKTEVIKVTNNLIALLSATDKHHKAIELVYKNIALCNESNNKLDLATLFSNTAIIYKELKNNDSAQHYYSLSLKLYEELGNKKGAAGDYFNLGMLHLSIGENIAAKESCLKGLKLAEESGALTEEQSACQCLYRVYKELREHNSSLMYYERSNDLKDSLQAIETSNILNKLKFDKLMYQDSILQVQREFAIEQDHQEEIRLKNRNRNILFLLIGGILVIVFIILGRMRLLRRSQNLIKAERDRSDALLLNILPEDIAEELKHQGSSEARSIKDACVLFSDFKGFTMLAEHLSAQELVSELNTCFKTFDNIMQAYQIEKIKTIGDAYMAASGLNYSEEDHVFNCVKAAIEMQEFIEERKRDLLSKGKKAFSMRIGLHVGEVVAGIVGLSKFQYDIWGDTVNTAARMESSGEVSKVNISDAVYQRLKNHSDLNFEDRGKIEAKNKGDMNMYFVSLR